MQMVSEIYKRKYAFEKLIDNDHTPITIKLIEIAEIFYNNSISDFLKEVKNRTDDLFPEAKRKSTINLYIQIL